MEDSEKESRFAQIASLGTPQHVIDYLDDQNFPRFFSFVYYGAVALYIVTMALGMMIEIVFIERFFEYITTLVFKPNADVIFNSYLFGGYILALFWPILAASVPLYSISRLFPRFNEYVAGKSMLDALNSSRDYGITEAIYPKLIASLPQNASAPEFLRIFNRKIENWLTKWVLIYLAVIFGFIAIDLGNYRELSGNSLRYSTYFSYTEERRPIETAIGTKTSCYTSKGSGRSGPTFNTSYLVTFPDNVTIDFMEDKQIIKKIDTALALDELLAANGVKITRSTYREKPAIDKTCISKLQRRYGEKTEKFMNLLHVADTPPVAP